MDDKWSTNDFLTILHHLHILLAIWDGGRFSLPVPVVLYCTVLHCNGDVAGDEAFLREEGEEHLVAFLVSSVSSRHSEVLHTYRCLHILLRRSDVDVSHEVEGVLIAWRGRIWSQYLQRQSTVSRERMNLKERERDIKSSLCCICIFKK